MMYFKPKFKPYDKVKDLYHQCMCQVIKVTVIDNIVEYECNILTKHTGNGPLDRPPMPVTVNEKYLELISENTNGMEFNINCDPFELLGSKIKHSITGMCGTVIGVEFHPEGCTICYVVYDKLEETTFSLANDQIPLALLEME